jgi:hypothetical protein
MVLNVLLWLYLRSKGGAPVLTQMCKHKLVILFGIATVFFSRDRVYFFPQTGVSWYDTRFMEDYELWAVGPSGARYMVHPSSITPNEMHWVQGRLCYAAKEKSITGIYGTAGSHGILMALENLKEPKDALKLLARGRSCANPERQKVFDEFMARYFHNMNERGRPYRWLSWIGRFTHIRLTLYGEELYDLQEPVERIELWRELVVHYDGELHRLERKLVHTVPIPP